MNKTITSLLFLLLFAGTTSNALASPLIPKKLCFQTDEPNAPNEWKVTWYLRFSPVEGEQNIYSVNGFELGEKKEPLETFVDGMEGTVVITPVSNMMKKEEIIHISLQGSGSDFKKDTNDNLMHHDLWHTVAHLDLNLETFEGNMMSTTTDTLIHSGIKYRKNIEATEAKDLQEKKAHVTTIARNQRIKSVACPASVTEILNKKYK